MFTHAYIISWFGKDNREKRKEYHDIQVQWMLDKGLNVVILSQHYNKEEYFEHENVRYIDGPSDTVLTPGQARNVLLKDFYNSDVDFAIFADNDSVLYDHCDGPEFINHINLNWDKYSFVDMAMPINPRNEPFNKRYKEEHELYFNNHVFKKTGNCKGSLFFLKNTKKHYDKEIYNADEFDNGPDGGILGGEDGDLALQFIVNGLGVYKFENVVLKEMGSDTYSTWSKDADHRNSITDPMHEMWYERYKQHGMEIKNKRIQRRNFMKKNFKRPDKLVIPYIDNSLESLFDV
jgi:hypothetical protein